MTRNDASDANRTEKETPMKVLRAETDLPGGIESYRTEWGHTLYCAAAGYDDSEWAGEDGIEPESKIAVIDRQDGEYGVFVGETFEDEYGNWEYDEVDDFVGARESFSAALELVADELTTDSDDEQELVTDGGVVEDEPGDDQPAEAGLTPDEIYYEIGDDIKFAFDDVEEFTYSSSPAVKDLVRGLDVEPDFVLALDADVECDDPMVYVSVYDAAYHEAAAVEMQFIDAPDAVFVDDVATVFDALRELAESEWCWTVRDPSGLAESEVEQ